MKLPKKKTKETSPMKTVLWVNALGIDFGVCVVAGYFLGDYLQRKLGSVLWLLFGLGLGIAAGVWSAAIIIKVLLERKDG